MQAKLYGKKEKVVNGAVFVPLPSNRMKNIKSSDSDTESKLNNYTLCMILTETPHTL